MAAPVPDRRAIVPALGITQILAWGSTFYLLAVLSRFIQKDTGWSYDLIVGGASIGLLVAGLLSPRVGRLIAERGGRPRSGDRGAALGGRPAHYRSRSRRSLVSGG